MAQLEEEEYFFNLPYWSSLLIRHNLDVMHIEKNICEALLGTLLEIAGKTKDTEKARLDLQDMGITILCSIKVNTSCHQGCTS